jgi:hypothetical protein
MKPLSRKEFIADVFGRQGRRCYHRSLRARLGLSVGRKTFHSSCIVEFCLWGRLRPTKAAISQFLLDALLSS